MEINIKRVYDPPDETDGLRILVDRLWPRGLSRSAATVHMWLKDLAPSTELRKWYRHEPGKWAEFKQRYFAELGASAAAVEDLMIEVRKGKVTFLYGSKEPEFNNAAALREYVASRM